MLWRVILEGWWPHWLNSVAKGEGMNVGRSLSHCRQSACCMRCCVNIIVEALNFH